MHDDVPTAWCCETEERSAVGKLAATQGSNNGRRDGIFDDVGLASFSCLVFESLLTEDERLEEGQRVGKRPVERQGLLD